MRLNITTVSTRDAKPKYNYGEVASLALDSGSECGLIHVTVPADIPDNAVITKADLVFRTVRFGLSGSRSISAQRNAANFKVSKATWNNRPALGGASHSVTVGAVPEGTQFRIDIIADVQAIVAGSLVNRGWRITTNDTSRVMIVGSKGRVYPPYLDLEYIVPGDAPVDLSPDGAAVSTPTPTMSFAVPDDTTSVQIKIATNPALTGAVTSAEIFTGVGLVDTTGLFTPTQGVPYYWAARAKNANGWSSWSDVAVFSWLAKPTVTITSPDATTGDKTPPVTWTATDQAAWRVRVFDATSGALLDDSGYEGGADQEWTPSKGMKRVGQSMRIVVDVWDNVDRVATAGEAIFSRGTLTTQLVALAATPGVDTLTASAGIHPYVRLAWSAGADADEWQIVRDGVWIDRVDGSLRAWRDYYAEPGRKYAYRVLPVVDSGVGPNGPTASVLLRPPGLWLFVGTQVVFLVDHEFTEVSWDERAVVHEILGDAPPVRRRAGQPPPRGAVSGVLIDGTDPMLTAERMKATAMGFKGSGQGRVYRMSYGDRNIPVTIGDLMVEPLNGTDSPLAYEISFKWWQTRDELPWES